MNIFISKKMLSQILRRRFLEKIFFENKIKKSFQVIKKEDMLHDSLFYHEIKKLNKNDANTIISEFLTRKNEKIFLNKKKNKLWFYETIIKNNTMIKNKYKFLF